jgi:hypothetical protein
MTNIRNGKIHHYNFNNGINPSKYLFCIPIEQKNTSIKLMFSWKMNLQIKGLQFYTRKQILTQVPKPATWLSFEKI